MIREMNGREFPPLYRPRYSTRSALRDWRCRHRGIAKIIVKAATSLTRGEAAVEEERRGGGRRP